jgi:putative peptide zinc metalloprotease protein
MSRLHKRLTALWPTRRGASEATYRPQLAAGVQLRGRMTESAFADQPWLVERNGRFLQVTEMLYRVAELADGTRSVADIARVLSARLAAEVGAEYVQRLLDVKLVPIGIIAADTATTTPPHVAPASGEVPRSPLALNLRMALVSPRLLEPVTRVLQYLYLPPVLVLVLFVTVQAQYWLFFVHSTTAAINQAFDTPGLVPVAFALMIASAAFHEVGHAAALRYGGGRVRSMGVGLYLMYPAFYTDVTDNYRLGRWARVRTDLGGFYFNLVFSLALMGLYHLTGQELLLLVAVLIDVDIAHQCLPFVRLDGYWALADLTGIPDFFSLMGAYLRSVLPLRRWTGRKLPRLRWWAKAVFGLYICLALPAIALLLLAMLNATPRVLMSAWQAVQRVVSEVAAAQARGDGLGVASAEAQALLVLLPAAGLCLMVLSLAHAVARGLWRWGQPTAARRLVASVAAASAAAFVILLWVPDLRPAVHARMLERGQAQAAAAAEPTVVTVASTPTREPAATPTPVEPVVAPTLEPPTATPTPTEVSRDGVTTAAELADDAPTPEATEAPVAWRPTEPPASRAVAAPMPRATVRPPSRASETARVSEPARMNEPGPAAPRAAPPQPAPAAPRAAVPGQVPPAPPTPAASPTPQEPSAATARPVAPEPTEPAPAAVAPRPALPAAGSPTRTASPPPTATNAAPRAPVPQTPAPPAAPQPSAPYNPRITASPARP